MHTDHRPDAPTTGPEPGRDPAAITIRALRPDDLPAIQEIVTSPHILPGTMRVPHAPPSLTAERLAPQRGQQVLVADADGLVVGFLVLRTHPDHARHRHVGDVDLVVTRAEWQRRGVAARLLAEVVDLADRWLQLERLELIVFEDNVHARRLYERFGFEVEGRLRRYGFADGRFTTALQMGRLRPRG